MAKTQKTAKTTTKNLSPVKELSRVTKTAKAPKAAKETAKLDTKKAPKKEHLGFRVYMLNPKSWEACKTFAQSQDTNTHTIIDRCITENLDNVVDALKKVGIDRGEKRVRMERPAQWDKLMAASADVGLPAQTLLNMVMNKTFSK